MGQDSGEGRSRQVTDLGRAPLVSAVEGPDRCLTKTSVADILVSCSTLGSAGCSLAWWLANAHEPSLVGDNQTLLEGVFSPDVWHRARRARQALPSRMGVLPRF